MKQHTGLAAHDGYAEHSHEIRPDHQGVARDEYRTPVVPGYQGSPADATADAMAALHDRILARVGPRERDQAREMLEDLLNLAGGALSNEGRDQVIIRVLGPVPLTFADWTAADDRAASREGWSLFDASGSADGSPQVQAIDDPEPGEGKLDGDLAAWALLRSSPDTPLHARALAVLRNSNAAEYQRIVAG